MNKSKNRRSEGQTTYPCDSVDTVLVASSLSTSMWRGPGRRDIRARSCTFVVCVAENNMDWRLSIRSERQIDDSMDSKSHHLVKCI